MIFYLLFFDKDLEDVQKGMWKIYTKKENFIVEDIFIDVDNYLEKIKALIESMTKFVPKEREKIENIFVKLGVIS